MAVTEAATDHMREQLKGALGDEATYTLMAHLPPGGWSEVATRTDLDHTAALLRGEMHAGFAELRGEMQAGFAELRGEMQAGFAELRAADAELRAADAELRSEMHAGFAELRGEMQAGFAELRAADASILAEIDRRFQRLLLQLGATAAATIAFVFSVGFAMGGR